MKYYMKIYHRINIIYLMRNNVKTKNNKRDLGGKVYKSEAKRHK